MRLERTVSVLFLAGLAALLLASALPARTTGWVPTGTVQGAVYLDGVPLAGVEVWLGSERYVCTDENGSFSSEVVADEPFPAATGRSLVAGCPNREFLDPATGRPLVTQYWDHHNGSGASVDLIVVPPDGVVAIRFDVVRAAAVQLAVLQSHGAPAANVDWVRTSSSSRRRARCSSRARSSAGSPTRPPSATRTVTTCSRGRPSGSRSTDTASAAPRMARGAAGRMLEVRCRASGCFSWALPGSSPPPPCSRS